MTSLPPTAVQEASFVVVFISNGPGELATWVRPLAAKLHNKILMRPKYGSSPISLRLVLVPCPNATGNELKAAKQWGQFEQIIPSTKFWKLLIRPKKYGIWPSNGLVVFLGGDQFWSVLLSARLRYQHLTYAEWVARWPQWNDRIAAMSIKVRDRLPNRFKKKCTVVGDLMADVKNFDNKEEPLPKGQWIALMPGSKSAKLSVGVPFLLEVADQLAHYLPESKFLLPVAPTTSIDEIQKFASSKNPITRQYTASIKAIIQNKKNKNWHTLITSAGTEVHLYQNHPAHNFISKCNLALTTIGANTAELGALGVPMIVIIPTQHLNVMQAWDGILGILGRLPFLELILGRLISIWKMRKSNFLAWPNISAGKMIVPEKIGIIYPKDIVKEALQWIDSPARLQGQKEDLLNIRGQPGAVELLTKEIIELIPRVLRDKRN